MTGHTVSHYRILGSLGGGGMGVVYLAEDTRLGRQVAIKFLPAHLAHNPEALDRFLREARSASSLNHPNICTLYDIGDHDGEPFLVMERLNGETVKERLLRGPIPLPELLDWSVQTGAALGAAHAAGVVHRDIKPANLFITTQGQVKILDFGLAKPLLVHQTTVISDDAVTQTILGDFQTTPGAVSGTIGYMSPEQARGEEVDARTDLFSFGVVLYEMSTGHQAFPGATSAVVFDAILNREPEPASVSRPELPPRLGEIIGRALEKDRRLRYQSAADLTADLQRLARDSGYGLPFSTRPYTEYPHRRPTMMRYALAAVAACLALAVAGVLWLARPQAPVHPLVPVQLTGNPSEIPIHSVMLSRDGRYAAYSDSLGVHVRAIASGESRTLAAEPGFFVVDWSADSTQIVALRNPVAGDFSVWAIPVLGGQPHTVGPGLASPDNRYVFTGKGIQAVDGSRAIPMHVAPNRIISLSWAPDSSRLAVLHYQPDVARDTFLLDVGDVATATTSTVAQSTYLTSVTWLTPGRLVYATTEPQGQGSGAKLWTLDFNRNGRSRGASKLWAEWPNFDVRFLSASTDGKRVAFLKEEEQSDVYIARLEERGKQISSPWRLTLDDRGDNATTWTPDNTAVLFESDRYGESHIFQQAIDSTEAELLITGPGLQVEPRLSPDGRWLLWAALSPGSNKHDKMHIMRMPWPGGGSAEVAVAEGHVLSFQCSAVPGGACILNEISGAEKAVWQFDPLAGLTREILRIPDQAGDAAISGDGRHIAFAFGAPLLNRIRVLNLDGKVEREITVPGATRLIGLDWSADGHSLFCGDVSATGSSILQVPLDGRAQTLWTQPGMHQIWAVPSRDGRYLAIHGATETSNVWTVNVP